MFKEIFEGLYLLKVPFGDSWTGVTLVDDDEKVLIDSGSRLEDCDEYIIPALNELGYKLEDITYLILIVMETILAHIIVLKNYVQILKLSQAKVIRIMLKIQLKKLFQFVLNILNIHLLLNLI